MPEVRIAATAYLATWFILAISGAASAHQPKPSNYVLDIVGRGATDLHTPPPRQKFHDAGFFSRPISLAPPSSRQAKKIPTAIRARNFLNAGGKLSVPTLRADVDGAIHILRDGNRLELSCFATCSEVMAQVNSPQMPPPQNQENAQQQ